MMDFFSSHVWRAPVLGLFILIGCSVAGVRHYMYQFEYEHCQMRAAHLTWQLNHPPDRELIQQGTIPFMPYDAIVTQAAAVFGPNVALQAQPSMEQAEQRWQLRVWDAHEDQVMAKLTTVCALFSGKWVVHGVCLRRKDGELPAVEACCTLSQNYQPYKTWRDFIYEDDSPCKDGED